MQDRGKQATAREKRRKKKVKIFFYLNFLKLLLRFKIIKKYINTLMQLKIMESFEKKERRK